MTKSPHVLMISNGAELFAKEQGLVMVEPAYFKTDFRWQQLRNALKDEKITLDHNGKSASLLLPKELRL